MCSFAHPIFNLILPRGFIGLVNSFFLDYLLVSLICVIFAQDF